MEAQSDKTLKLRADEGRRSTAERPLGAGEVELGARAPAGERRSREGKLEGEAGEKGLGRETREDPRDATRVDEPVWKMPPPALLPPIERSAPTAPPPGAALAAAEAAALAERVLSSFKVGRVAGMPEVRMRLGLGSRAFGSSSCGVEVRLRLDEGRVVPVLVTDRPSDVAELAERLDALFAERGIDAERVVIERG